MPSLCLVPPEKSSSEANRPVVTATLRVWPAMAAQLRRLHLSHDFGPTQAAQWLCGIGVEVREVLGDRWHTVAELAERAGQTPGAYLGRLIVKALDAGLAEDGSTPISQRRSK